MMKKLIIFLLIFQFNSALGQKTVEQIINDLTQNEFYASSYGYFDSAGKTQGVSIQNEPQVLERLGLETLEYGEYYLTGKYEINSSLVLFLSKYWETEDSHFALLLDKSFHVIDRLDETAYSNTEGFYTATTSVDLNIMTTTVHNIYHNPEYFKKKYTITDEGFRVIKDQVVVNTPSGILIREEPTIASTIVGSVHDSTTFNYLSRGYELDSTAVFEDGRFLKDYWLKVAGNDSFSQIGYVFGAFAKRRISLITNDYHVIVNEISEEEFFAKENKKASKPVVEKITDLTEIQKVLGNQLILEFNIDYGYHEIKKVIADNGLEISSHFEECGVLAYYPKLHYLLLECGHSSEYIIDLKNGEDDINRIGNPDYYLSSPENTFRLNGYYSGQSNIHFLEQNIKNGAPEYLFSFSSLLSLDYIETYFWKDENTIFAKVENEFYKIQLQKNVKSSTH